MKSEQIIVVDFGSQYSKLLVKKIRDLNYFCVIDTVENTIERIKKGERPLALILSGGPQSSENYDYSWREILSCRDLPILGICYGAQFIVQKFGGEVVTNTFKQFGRHTIETELDGLNVDNISECWMSHNDSIVSMPEDFKIFSRSSKVISGFLHEKCPVMGLQFHPEVDQTDRGKEYLSYFLRSVAKIKRNWFPEKATDQIKQELEKFKDCKILCALSGGVDSLVTATLAKEVLKDSLTCFFVDTGLCRETDLEVIDYINSSTNLEVSIINAQDLFYSRLDGISDPEGKRKAIGNAFIEVFQQQFSQGSEKFTHLLQGTLYPDVIESLSPFKKNGKSVTIKSHHNVGGLPENLNLKIIEPFREFFKNEVRLIGKSLGIPDELLNRHPFPGPGLGIRSLGEVNRNDIEMLRKADTILQHEIREAKYYGKTDQAAVILLPIYSVGVKGDQRAYERVAAIRMVNTNDFMTADFSRVPYNILEKISRRITNEIDGIVRVVYDISSKPPSTIEWE